MRSHLYPILLLFDRVIVNSHLRLQAGCIHLFIPYR